MDIKDVKVEGPINNLLVDCLNYANIKPGTTITFKRYPCGDSWENRVFVFLHEGFNSKGEERIRYAELEYPNTLINEYAQEIVENPYNGANRWRSDNWLAYLE